MTDSPAANPAVAVPAPDQVDAPLLLNHACQPEGIKQATFHKGILLLYYEMPGKVDFPFFQRPKLAADEFCVYLQYWCVIIRFAGVDSRSWIRS